MTTSLMGQDPINGNGEEREKEILNCSAEERELSQQVEESVKVKADKKPLSLIEEDKWQTFTSFIVKFQSKQVEGRTELQTIIHDLDTDTTKTWSGIERSQLQQWMLDLITEKMQLVSEPETLAVISPVTVQIIQLQAFQPPQTEVPMVVDRTGQGFPNFIKSSVPFALEITVSLAGLNVADVAKQKLIFCTKAYARHRATGAITNFGNTQFNSLIKNQLSYTIRLPETTLQPGMYRLQILVTLQGLPATPGCFEVPLLQVV
ncbi:MAG: hypothetical protein Fur006_49530 [Coleofasciculaceae cyanobacterium]